MRNAIAKTYHSLDLVDELVAQWQGGSVPVLNKARLVAAKQGVLGPEAQKIATLLDQQINDVVGEMANVLMGGNSPTDRGLELASHNMKAEWSQGTLTAAVNQARRNLKLAQQAMFETVPAGTSPNNQYWEGAAGTREGAAPPVTRKRWNPKTKKLEIVKE